MHIHVHTCTYMYIHKDIHTSYTPYRVNRLPQQQATCTRGPSFPKLRPAPTASTIPTDLTISVQAPRYPRITNPLKIVLT